MLLEKINNWAYESWYNIDTRGRNYSNGNYSTLPYSVIWKVLDRLALHPDDTFVDVGSGKGRVLCCVARTTACRIIGVESATKYCRVAVANAERMQHKYSRIEIFNIRAEAFDYKDATVLFFFCPVDVFTLDKTLQRIKETRQGAIRMAYVNLNPEWKAVFAKHDWLMQYDERVYRHPIGFYKGVKS